MRTAELFDLTKTAAQPLLSCYDHAEKSLTHLHRFIEKLGGALDTELYTEMSPGVWAAKSAVICENAQILAPCIIGEGAVIRQCAYIRGSVLVGRECVIGNSTEVKNSILFDRVQIPHFNYVGDSVLGYAVHLGAGAVTSNVKSDKSEVYITHDGVRESSGRRKLGAVIGDMSEIGCGAVLCPGTVIGKNTTVYPLTLVRGTVPSGSILKNDGTIVGKY